MKVQKCKQWIWHNFSCSYKYASFVPSMKLVSFLSRHDQIIMMINIRIWINPFTQHFNPIFHVNCIRQTLIAAHWIDGFEKVSLKQKISSSTSSWFFSFLVFAFKLNTKLSLLFCLRPIIKFNDQNKI